MKIVLVDHNPEVVDNWQRLSKYEGHCSDLFSVPFDAVVSPGNAFGFMDGNLDYVISTRLGWDVQARLQEHIRTLPYGELLVGQAVAIETLRHDVRLVICAPTMRVPKIIDDPMDIFLACRAAVMVARASGVRTLAFSGMGTGCGQVNPKIAVEHMVCGIREAYEPSPYPASWKEAQERHYDPMRSASARGRGSRGTDTHSTPGE